MWFGLQLDILHCCSIGVNSCHNYLISPEKSRRTFTALDYNMRITYSCLCKIQRLGLLFLCLNSTTAIICLRWNNTDAQWLCANIRFLGKYDFRDKSNCQKLEHVLQNSIRWFSHDLITFSNYRSLSKFVTTYCNYFRLCWQYLIIFGVKIV